MAGVIHQPFVGVGGTAAADYLPIVYPLVYPSADAAGGAAAAPDDAGGGGRVFGAGRTMWGAIGMGTWSHEGRRPLSATPMPPPRAADPAALRVATTRSHPGRGEGASVSSA